VHTFFTGPSYQCRCYCTPAYPTDSIELKSHLLDVIPTVWPWAGRSGDRIRVGKRFFAPIQNGPVQRVQMLHDTYNACSGGAADLNYIGRTSQRTPNKSITKLIQLNMCRL